MVRLEYPLKKTLWQFSQHPDPLPSMVHVVLGSQGQCKALAVCPDLMVVVVCIGLLEMARKG